MVHGQESSCYRTIRLGAVDRQECPSYVPNVVEVTGKNVPIYATVEFALEWYCQKLLVNAGHLPGVERDELCIAALSPQ